MMVRWEELAGTLLSSLIVPAAYSATIAVDSGGDVVAADGACTLREAISSANGKVLNLKR